jgi:hypothetical protein
LYGIGEESHPSLNLEKVRRETGVDEPSSHQKLLPVTGTKVDGVWRGRGLSRRAFAILSEKIWL